MPGVASSGNAALIATFSVTYGPHLVTLMTVSGQHRSRLPELKQTVLGVGANKVLMWVMNDTNDVFLMNLDNRNENMSTASSVHHYNYPWV